MCVFVCVCVWERECVYVCVGVGVGVNEQAHTHTHTNVRPPTLSIARVNWTGAGPFTVDNDCWTEVQLSFKIKHF